MKKIIILSKNKSKSIVPRITSVVPLCYYLCDDYAYFLELEKKFLNRPQIRGLTGIFQEKFEEIKEPFLELIARINKERNSFSWWGTHLASRSSSATKLLQNITYLFCAKKIIADSNKDVIFIVDSLALSECLSEIADTFEYKVINYWSIADKWLWHLRRGLFNFIKIIYFLWQVLESRSQALKLLKTLPSKKKDTGKRVVIRSWVTKSNFEKTGKFKDRNFGDLLNWLCLQGYEVWVLPMFFNLSMSMKEIYALIKNQEQQFLIPESYLKLSDYFWLLYDSYEGFKQRVEKAEILGTNVTPLLNEILGKGFALGLLTLNLCCPMLKRLKQRGYEIDAFYYAFECGPPEKQFILSCRKYFPEAKLIGFQHTAFFSTQLACHLGPEEVDCHPLPDKIVCSGHIYLDMHKKARFPVEILVEGPNLRFDSVYSTNNEKIYHGNMKALMLPLTFSYDLAFELIAKVNGALLKDYLDYRVYIRSHPLLSKKALISFINKIGMHNYEFADEGIIQDWFTNTHAVVSSGGSITILEAVAFGAPVIRVIPDNNFLHDPFIWPDYPLIPVSTSSEILQQIQSIDKILENDKDTFRKIAREVLKAYFTKPSKDNLRVFL